MCKLRISLQDGLVEEREFLLLLYIGAAAKHLKRVEVAVVDAEEAVLIVPCGECRKVAELLKSYVKAVQRAVRLKTEGGLEKPPAPGFICE